MSDTSASLAHISSTSFRYHICIFPDFHSSKHSLPRKMPSQTNNWRELSVGVVGGGIGGVSVAIALRRAGHRVTIYERADFAGEVGASVSCAANGTRWLHEWGVDVEKGDPVVLRKLINRDWKTGEPVSVYDLDDYEERWGYVYNMFHRQYMHSMLMDSAVGDGEGVPAKLLVNHKVSRDICVTFEQSREECDPLTI